MEKYIKEGLLALLPCYREGAGGTAVFTLQGKYRDRRETTWLVKRLAAFYSIDLPARNATGTVPVASQRIAG